MEAKGICTLYNLKTNLSVNEKRMVSRDTDTMEHLMLEAIPVENFFLATEKSSISALECYV